MNQTPRFERGDAVMHPRKPEWGRGVVKDARTITHEGRPAQRLSVEFANRGRVVINTAVAPLTTPEKVQEKHMTTSTSGGWLDSLEKSSTGPGHELWTLPHELTDPFASLVDRLKATVQTYRFSTEPRSLLEWATIQTGLDDPLSKYSRSELEHAFPRFARDRDQHVKDLVRQLKRKGMHAELKQVVNKTQLPAARSALDKAVRS